MRFRFNRRSRSSAKTVITIHRTGGVGIRSGPDRGGRSDKVVVRVAVQNAGDELVLAVGTQFVALPRLVDPFLNCTVPVGPAPLLVVMTVAVSVMLPPEVIE